MGKFDAKIDEGIILGYSPESKAYICINFRISKVVKSVDVIVDYEILTSTSVRIKQEDDGPKMEKTQVNQNKEQTKETQQEQQLQKPLVGKEIKNTQQNSKTPSRYVQKHHSDDLIIGDKNACVQTRKRKMEDPLEEVNIGFLSHVEPSSFK